MPVDPEVLARVEDALARQCASREGHIAVVYAADLRALLSLLRAPDGAEFGVRVGGYYPDFIEDAEGLERWRQTSRSGSGHDVVANKNTVLRFVQTIDRLKNALSRRAPDGGVEEAVARIIDCWQPIETAPKDGAHILGAIAGTSFGWVNGGQLPEVQTVVHWWDAAGEEGFYTSVNEVEPRQPFAATHWKPLAHIEATARSPSRIDAKALIVHARCQGLTDNEFADRILALVSPRLDVAENSTRRFMDSHDAYTHARAAVDDAAMVDKLRDDEDSEPHSRLIRSMSFNEDDGGAIFYWRDGRLRAAALVVRDTHNYSVALRFLSAAPSPPSIGSGEATDEKVTSHLDLDMPAFERLKDELHLLDKYGPDAWVLIQDQKFIGAYNEFADAVRSAGDKPSHIRQVQQRPVFAPMIVVAPQPRPADRGDHR